jgi:3-methylcrotonyl-CoA carboxylase alpha subunit
VLPAARRVARAAFGDDTLLLERYLERPRHVEVQVFADDHGACIHLFERDCSLQRRHQKVVEEAPAPGLPGNVRARMGETAVAAARAIGYVGAGTVEFLYDPERERFHFMEMNTRLQVEHPVTEMVTGIDLVAWQLRVAAGEPLPLAQHEVACHGHAIEVRLYAEDPARDFLPASGPVDWFDTPAGDGHLRVDAGVRAGDAVGVHYDPMIAKLIVHGADRHEAAARLVRALAATDVGPLASNLPFLRALATHPAWLEADVDTGFIRRHAESLAPARMPRNDALAAAAAYLLSTPVVEGAGPWERLRGFRLNLPRHERLRLGVDGDAVDVAARHEAGDIHLTLDGETLRLDAPRRGAGETVRYAQSGRGRRVRVHAQGEILHLDDGRARRSITRLPPATPAGDAQGHGAGQLVAPMPGRVVTLAVAPGDRVASGQALVVLEAMKMEHTLTAPGDGEVTAVGCTAGAQVDEGVVLINLELD